MLWIWIGLIITLILIELLAHNLVTIWYIGSAFIALILSLFIDNYLVQFLVFTIIGTVLMFTLRDNTAKSIRKKLKEKLINKQGIVVEEIKKNKPGKVKINKIKYIATSSKKIKIGRTIKVIEINNNKLKVIEDNNE